MDYRERYRFILSQNLDQYYLNDILPYDPNKKTRASLRSGLNEYLVLLSGAVKAIEALELNDLEQFDALVGENACQIRAIWIAIMSSKTKSSLDVLKKKIIKSKELVSKLLENKLLQKFMNDGVTLEELFIKENLRIMLNVEEAFFIQCFFLREVKVSNCKEAINDSILIKEKCTPKKLKKFGEASSSFADNLVSKLRKITARQSVQFVRKYAEKSKDKNLLRMLSDEFTVDHNNHLLCTPMFWTYKSILFAAKLENIKIVLHSKLISNNKSAFGVLDERWFDSDFEGEMLTVKNMEWDSLDSMPCIVFQGVAQSKYDWESGLQGLPLDTIILAGAADHRQYPSVEDNDRFFQLVQDHELETYKSIARKQGFSFENPSRFFIQHVYAAHTQILRLRTPMLIG